MSDIERCKQLIQLEHANWIGISNQLAIAHLIERAEELEEENRQLEAIKDDAIRRYNLESIPKQKVKEFKNTITQEYNKVQEQFDCIWNKKSKNNYDRYKLQELSAMQQELGFILEKLEELLEEK